MTTQDNLISFWIGNKNFSIETPEDNELLTAALLEYTETYTYPVILEDRIIYAPFQFDRDQLFQRHGGYKRHLSSNAGAIKKLIETINKGTNGENRRDVASAA